MSEENDIAAFYAAMEVPDTETVGWTLTLPHETFIDPNTGDLLPDIAEWARDNLTDRYIIYSPLTSDVMKLGRFTGVKAQIHFFNEQDYVFFKMWWE